MRRVVLMGKKPTKRHIRRKSHKERRYKPSVNKYAHRVCIHPWKYDGQDKTFRDLPVLGKPGKVVKTGLREIFHGRLYELMEDVTVPKVSVIPGTHVVMGRFKLIQTKV